MALKNSQITLFAVVRENGAVWVKVAEQDNQPVLEETINPQGGPWGWDIEQPTGFVGAPNISLDVDLVDGKTAQISWSNFTVGDWRDGKVGSFRVQLTDGNDNQTPWYTVDLALRTIPWIDFTAIEDQSSAGANAVRQAPCFGGAWGFSATPQPGFGITVDGEGRITVVHGGDWSDKSTTFELTIGDGVPDHPESTFDGSRAGSGNASQPTLALRKLTGDGYTIVAGQTSGGNAISADAATGTGNFKFTPSNLPSGVTLTLDTMGQVKTFTGNHSGSFDLEIQDGTRPSSFISRNLDFRALTTTDGLALFKEQVDSEALFSAGPAIATSYSLLLMDHSGLPTDLQLELNPLPGTVLGVRPKLDDPDAPTWLETGTATLCVQDDVRPWSYIAALPIRLRTLTPKPVRLPGSNLLKTADAGSLDIDVPPTSSPEEVWSWSGFAASFAHGSVLNAIAPMDAPQLTISWNASALKATDQGTLEGWARPAATTIPKVKVALPVRVRGALALTPVALPSATENRTYQTEIACILDPEAEPLLPGDTFNWSFPTSAPAEITDVLELVDGMDGQHKILRTKQSPTVLYLPFWGGSTKTIPVSIRRSRAGLDLDGEGSIDLALPVTDTVDDRDVAILLDRSGSMTGDRWEAAVNGAQIFADLVKVANTNHVDGDPTNPLHGHRVGVYWFWGNPAAANYPDPTTAKPGYPEGYANVLSSGTTSFAIDVNTAVDPAATVKVVDAGLASAPGNFTALGTGLLLCRDELVAKSDAAHGRNRLILALTDGMENSNPLIADVFAGSTPIWKVPVDPKIRIYTVAVFTGASYADKLKQLATWTGVDPTEGVKAIDDPTDYQTRLLNWFCFRFSDEFDFSSTSATPDPELAKGGVATRSIEVAPGQDRLVFTALFAKPDRQGNEWDLTLTPPQGRLVGEALPQPGVAWFRGSMYRMVAVDVPAWEEGSGRSPYGRWTMTLTRKGASSCGYAFGTMAHGIPALTCELIAPPLPAAGLDQGGLLVTTSAPDATIARATARISTPGRWRGHDVACRVATDRKLVLELQKKRKGSVSLRDCNQVADNVLRLMLDKGSFDPPSETVLKLAKDPGGSLSGHFPLPTPGQYTIDVGVDGKDAAGKKFHVEFRKQLFVPFPTDAVRTPTQGYFSDAKTVRLGVQPRDKDGLLLGPGFGDDVAFVTPLGDQHVFPADDTGNGNYWADIPIEGVDIRLSRGGRSIAGTGLSLRHPHGLLRLPGDEIRLDECAAVVQGVRVPIRVMAIIGNERTHVAHLATCRYLGAASTGRAWFHDLHEARAAGYRSCEHCLPLIGNASPNSLEVHRPYCPFVRAIRPDRRLTLSSWEQAKALGFDGCHHCLPEHDTRHRHK
ncbi:MAG: VWA domain-containing protein [Deltaproteobacteria bacterium]|nr:VWA domain-containing protein [Deltaproteobacteria bacterium]